MSYDVDLILGQYSNQINNVFNLGRMAQVSLGFIVKTIKLQRGALFVIEYDEVNEVFQAQNKSIVDKDGVTEKYLFPSGTLSTATAILFESQNPLMYHILENQNHLAEDRAWFTTLNMAVYVPVYADDEWVGLLAFGPKTSGSIYGDGDLHLLSTLAQQTATPLFNARLFNKLLIRNMEIERLNQELIQANHKLGQLDQAKSDFIGIASHELRTPLTYIKGYNDYS